MPLAPEAGRMTSTVRSCLGCVFHNATAILDGYLHLCILPPDCAPPHEHGNDDDWWCDRETEGRIYLGTSCDVMRRMGAACGPHAAMWLDAHASPAACTTQGDNA